MGPELGHDATDQSAPGHQGANPHGGGARRDRPSPTAGISRARGRLFDDQHHYGAAMNPRMHHKSSRQASVLIIVLWVAFGLVAMTLYFAHAMLLDLKAADNRAAGPEAVRDIEGAALYVSNVLANRVNMMAIPSAAGFRANAGKIGEAKFWLIGRDTNDLQSSGQA